MAETGGVAERLRFAAGWLPSALRFVPAAAPDVGVGDLLRPEQGTITWLKQKHDIA